MTTTRKRQRPAPKAPEPVEGGYRCTECGHGERLWAYAGANIYGPLAADGSELSEHEAVEEWGIHEDSIECADHPGAMLERFAGGRWCRWWSCPKCGGSGRIRIGEYWQAQDGYPCSGGIEVAVKYGTQAMHEGWLPAGGHDALASA